MTIAPRAIAQIDTLKGQKSNFIDFHLITKSCVRNGLLQQKGIMLCPLWQIISVVNTLLPTIIGFLIPRR